MQHSETAEETGPEQSSPQGLATPLEAVPGIGPRRAALLAGLGLDTVGALLRYFPRDYEDRRAVTPIAEAEADTVVTIEAEVVSARSVRLRGRQSLAVVTLRDETGEMKASFFGRGFLANSTFRKGVRGFFHGTVGEYKGPCLKSPDHEIIDAEDGDARIHTGRIVPKYPLTEGITQRMLRTWVHQALAWVTEFEETLPDALLSDHGLLPVAEACRSIHFPDSLEAAVVARRRFAFEELLVLQLGLLAVREAQAQRACGIRHKISGPRLAAFRAALPFALTPDQQRVVDEILADMASPRPMARLLQGDVGCGKTAVALHAVAAAADSGCQTALMAPTEILAEQHYLQLASRLEGTGIRTVLLTGGARGAAALRREIAAGEADVVVGTHALVQESTAFKRLGLVIIDEQHRFGVAQRGRLADKGDDVDVLHMTATPIPRTLALTLHGGMDLSIIETMPPGRKPVKTRRVPEGKVGDLYGYLVAQAAAGRQAYIVCKLIDESENWDVTPVLRHYEELSQGPLASLRCALLHGRLDREEKEAIMAAFKEGDIDVLFSTTVIEVGVDVPAATTMVIEDAAQFGLTQLHQLRGRVGRGDEQSYCFLLGKAGTKDGLQRLKKLCAHNSGFDIAEADLELRGPGAVHGLRQAGVSDLRAAELPRDLRLLEEARRAARSILDIDPHFQQDEHLALGGLIRERARPGI